MSKTLLLATRNRGKQREYEALLNGLPVEIITLADAGIEEDVEENGLTFEENAIAKAARYASLSGMVTLADDSGLEVDALGGEPGVRSRRYAGQHASDQQRIDFLLAKIKDVPREKRTARFRCVIAIATPSGKVETCQGVCEGLIGYEPAGTEGFGYDPVFFLPQYGKTMAELPFEEKNRISHRGQAALKARTILDRIFAPSP